jgi:uncharacterized protein YndB with AHSA1/START domain
MEQRFLYSVAREFAHPVARLWEAWTSADELQTWYHPTDLLNVPGSAQSQAHEGGVWKIAVDVPAYGFVAYFYGVYTKVAPLTQLEHSLYYTQSEPEWQVADLEAPHHRIVVDFEDRGGACVVTFTQFGEMPEEQIPQTQAGMESYFDSLEAHLASSPL